MLMAPSLGCGVEDVCIFSNESIPAVVSTTIQATQANPNKTLFLGFCNKGDSLLLYLIGMVKAVCLSTGTALALVLSDSNNGVAGTAALAVGAMACSD